jgi:hypothetical protein
MNTSPSVSSKPHKPQSKVEFPMKEAESLGGITSKSVLNDDPEYALTNVPDLTSESRFGSKNGPGQWVCWDFRQMRVRPTHYTNKTAAAIVGC